ncbi:MAG TPA: hypothetical protein VEU74_01170 [Gemmatimonadales bacterium]|nr:hypothetical protein [Gemmatimonadales bacterium]
MHIDLTEMLRCPEPHDEAFLVMSTGEMRGRMVRSGLLGCPVCGREYPLIKGVARFSGLGEQRAVPAALPVDAESLQAFLDLSGPGGYVVLVGNAARHAVGLAGLMGGIHFVGIDAPPDVEELPVLSLLSCDSMIPLRRAVARAVVVGRDHAEAAWLAEAERILLPGRRLVVEREDVTLPAGLTRVASGQRLLVAERR